MKVHCFSTASLLARVAMAVATTLAGLAVCTTAADAATRTRTGPLCTGTSFQWTGAVDSSWGNVKNWQPNGTPGACAADSVVIPIEANITGMPATTLASLTVQSSAGTSGSLAGGPLTVTGQFEWDGGTLLATVTLPVGASGSIGGPANGKGIGGGGTSLPGHLDVFGSLTLNDLSGSGGQLFLSGGSAQGLITIEAGATLTSTGTDAVNAGCCGPQNGMLVNDGTIDVTDGQLSLGGAELQQSNVLTVGAGALLDANAPLTFGSGSSYGGSGEMLLDLNAHPATLAGNISLGSGFVLELGPQACMDGSGTMSGAGTFAFTGGDLAADVTIANGTTMHVTGPGGKDLSTFACGSGQGQIVNQGTIVDDQGNFSFGTTGTVTNEAGATFQLAPGATMTTDSCCNPTAILFSNQGTLDVPAPPPGVTSGTPARINPVPMSNTGTIDVASGQQLLLSGGPTTLTGGTLEGSGGTTAIETAVTAGGTITLGSGFTLELGLNGSIDGIFTLAGSGRVNWTDGSMSGTVTVPSTIPLNISGSTRHQVTGRPNGQASLLTTHDKVTIAGGSTSSPDVIWVNNGDQWVNAGRITAPANTSFGASSCCGPTFGLKNTGTFTVAAGGGTVAADGLQFDNAGKLKVTKGTLVLATFEQTAGSTTLSGGGISDVGTPLMFSRGVLSGFGTIAASVTNGSTVQPSTTGGVLKISGNYQQTSGGTLKTLIAGATPGAGYGQLAVGGSATLAGQLEVLTVNGFTPSSGETFASLVYGSRSGQFSSLTGTPGFSLSYTPTEADVTFGP